MEYDLLVRGGRVVDGSGLPAYLADLAIKGGDHRYRPHQGECGANNRR